VHMVSGVAGSGKDHFIKTKPDLASISLDEIRKELKVKHRDKKGQGRVLSLAKERCREQMRQHNDFILNATNISKQTRAKWIRLFRKYGYRIEITYIEPDFKTILEQNKNREDSVPESVVRTMFKFLDVPSILECHEINYRTY
jgi:predicted kinase